MRFEKLEILIKYRRKMYLVSLALFFKCTVKIFLIFFSIKRSRQNDLTVALFTLISSMHRCFRKWLWNIRPLCIFNPLLSQWVKIPTFSEKHTVVQNSIFYQITYSFMVLGHLIVVFFAKCDKNPTFTQKFTMVEISVIHNFHRSKL